MVVSFLEVLSALLPLLDLVAERASELLQQGTHLRHFRLIQSDAGEGLCPDKALPPNNIHHQ